VFAVLSFLPVLYLTWILPDQPLYSIPSPWLALSLGLQAVAGLALAVSLWQTGAGSFLGLRQLVEPDRAGESRLVVKGLYRWVRHPLYTAGLLFIWLTPVMTVNLLALNVGLSGYIVAGALLEESKLRYKYGGAYVEYQKRTPMLIPTLRRR
jgi:protein-S-isoprenylcysteine O-methyltransferase Ste14